VKASRFESGKNIKFNSNKKNNQIKLQIPELDLEVIDQVIVLEIKK
jgi:diaminopimelate epimerase